MNDKVGKQDFPLLSLLTYMEKESLSSNRNYRTTRKVEFQSEIYCWNSVEIFSNGKISKLLCEIKIIVQIHNTHNSCHF